uniref:Uncharacterized protein LOC100177370 n=1 Tax=Phallusia mammillata TaxID=59560 RepID=A0A6F9DGW0_9ASCI|nr:uncharacterized protein LOC100177370 [Phallusia mammillata]
MLSTSAQTTEVVLTSRQFSSPVQVSSTTEQSIVTIPTAASASTPSTTNDKTTMSSTTPRSSSSIEPEPSLASSTTISASKATTFVPSTSKNTFSSPKTTDALTSTPDATTLVPSDTSVPSVTPSTAISTVTASTERVLVTSSAVQTTEENLSPTAGTTTEILSTTQEDKPLVSTTSETGFSTYASTTTNAMEKLSTTDEPAVGVSTTDNNTTFDVPTPTITSTTAQPITLETARTVKSNPGPSMPVTVSSSTHSSTGMSASSATPTDNVGVEITTTLSTSTIGNVTTKVKPNDPEKKDPDGSKVTEPGVTHPTTTEGKDPMISTTPSYNANGTTTNGGSTITIKEKGKTIPIKSGFKTICKPDNITILVDKSVIGEYESKFGPLHLNDYEDPRCRGVEYEDYYRYTIAPDILDCGTEFEVNETHVNFTNVVSNSQRRAQWLKSIGDSNGQVILGNRLARLPMVFVHMNIWCTFPIDVNVSTPFLPQIQIHMLTFNVSGHGQFSALMQLYKTEAFEDPYLRPPTLAIDDNLHVGISLLESRDMSTFLVVRECWATPARDHNHPNRYDIISESCAIPGSLDDSIRILENGMSKRARWQGSVFKFVEFDHVWLHCEIRVCFGDNCQPNCVNSRARRDTRNKEKQESLHILSAGPVVIGKKINATTPQPKASATTNTSGSILEETTVLILVISLSVIIVFCCIVIICVLYRLRRQRRRNKQLAGATNLATAPFDSRGFRRSSIDHLENAVGRSNSSMSTFSSSRCASPQSMSPTISAISPGRYGYDNTNFFSSTTELREAEEVADDFPAPPSELLAAPIGGGQTSTRVTIEGAHEQCSSYL